MAFLPISCNAQCPASNTRSTVTTENKYVAYIHSADLVRAFSAVIKSPKSGEAYNVGADCTSNCSMLEAIKLAEEIAATKLNWTYVDRPELAITNGG